MQGPSKGDPFQGCPDFERPILELDQKIKELESLGETTHTDFTQEVQSLRDLRDKLVKKIYMNLDPWDRVKLARHPLRPLTSHYIDLIFNNFVELFGDRLFGDDRAVVTGFAMLGDERVLLVGHRKGQDVRERLALNFGCAHPEGYRKA